MTDSVYFSDYWESVQFFLEIMQAIAGDVIGM